MLQPMDRNQPRTWQDFPNFINNPTIQGLGEESRWTVSSLDPISVTSMSGESYLLPAKSPLDARELITHGRVRGAWATDSRCLLTLPELNDAIPNLTNNAFYLIASIDDVLVLDIEPSCPKELRDQMLSLPYLYRETSMSGKGYHIVMPIPDNFYDFPAATNKLKLQHEKKWFEILINHWITFTRTPIPESSIELSETSTKDQSHRDGPSWEDLYASLAANANETASAQFDVDLTMPELPFAEQAVELMTRRRYPKSTEDFSGDISRWEFGVMGYLHSVLKTFLTVPSVARARDWNDSDKSWLLYQAARQVIPHRLKHDEIRNRMPYLLYRAMTMVARDE